MTWRPAESHTEGRIRRLAYPSGQARQKRSQRRARRRALDRIMWTAAGMALGAGLVILATYIMIGDWI